MFEELLKIDPETGERKIIIVKDERVFKKSFKDGKVAGVRTEYRDKKVGKMADGKDGFWIMKTIDGFRNTKTLRQSRAVAC